MNEQIINEMDQHYLDYGIVDSKEEISAYLHFVKDIALSIFKEDFEDLDKLDLETINEILNSNIKQEYVMRFVYGFNEGTFHSILTIMAKMLEEGASYETIHRYTNVAIYKIKEFDEFLNKSRTD